MTKILVWGDAGCGTGFARVTHSLMTGLVEKYGYDIDVVAINYTGDSGKWKHLPFDLYCPTAINRQDTYGFSRLPELVLSEKPDVLLLFNDIPLISEAIQSLMRDLSTAGVQMPELAFIGYAPIDCENLPASWSLLADAMDVFATYSNFGHAQLKVSSAQKEKFLGVIPHAVDPKVFYPIRLGVPGHIVDASTGEDIKIVHKEHAKHILNQTDKFVVLWADRNDLRKAPQIFLEAVAPFLLAHDDAVAWMHCEAVDQGGSIATYIERFGLSGRVFMSRPGIGDAEMNVLYNAADVKVSTAVGEGFGLTNAEASMCGIPVVACDNSVNREVLGPGALYVDKAYKLTTQRGVDVWYPKVEQYTEHLEKLYADEGLRSFLGAMGRKKVEKYTWATAVSDMHNVIQRGLAIRDKRIADAVAAASPEEEYEDAESQS